MADKRNIHVVKHGEGWATRREGAERVSEQHKTQNDAIAAARERAKTEKVEVVIHGTDGRIRDKDSYGNDPYPPKDRKH